MSLPGRFLDIGGLRIFYHRAGRGKPLVLLHGFGLSHWSWRAVVPGLAAEHDVVAIDLPGFGESDRPRGVDFGYDAAAYLETVIGVLDELGLERASFMGHSMGGAIALVAGARRPERVERLVLVDPLIYPYRLPPEGWALLLPYLGGPLFRTLSTRGLVRRFLARHIYHDAAQVSDDAVDYVWERLNRPGGFEAAHAALRFVAEPAAVASSVRAVRAPVLVVWGEEDRLFPAAHARRLAGELPGARLHLIPRCGHAPAEEQPAALLDAVLPFLAAGAERPPLRAVSP